MQTALKQSMALRMLTLFGMVPNLHAARSPRLDQNDHSPVNFDLSSCHPTLDTQPSTL